MKVKQTIFALTFILALVFPSYFIPRDSFIPWISSMAIAFGCYFHFCFSSQSLPWQKGLLIGFLARAFLLFSFPVLSDDIYRFLWDGMMTINGINPYALTPSDVMLGSYASSAFEHLYPELNSPNYFSVYPPVLQWLFAGVAYVSGGAIGTFSFLLKLLYIGIEALTVSMALKLLPHINLKPERVLLYALNPLVILEGVGNLHPESLMIAFLILSLCTLHRRKWVTTGIWFALSISTKLTSLLLWPLYFRLMGSKRWLRASFILVSTTIILWLPLMDWSMLLHILESINLYFQRFEFNASIYYLLRTIGEMLSGYNPIAIIGPLTALLGGLLILFTYRLHNETTIGQICSLGILILSIYYLFATTVHPWYLLLPTALSIFSPLRYILIWTGLICLSYAHYSPPMESSNWWLIVEYGGLIGALYADRGILGGLVRSK